MSGDGTGSCIDVKVAEVSRRFDGDDGGFDVHFSVKLRQIGTTLMPAKATAIHVMPFVAMSLHAVIARTPPIVRFALHRRRSPLVLKTSVISILPRRFRIGLAFIGHRYSE